MWGGISYRTTFGAGKLGGLRPCSAVATVASLLLVTCMFELRVGVSGDFLCGANPFGAAWRRIDAAYHVLSTGGITGLWKVSEVSLDCREDCLSLSLSRHLAFENSLTP